MKATDLAALFRDFRYTVFRLETLPTYSIEGEAESLALWRAGQPEPAWRNDRPWLTTVRQAVAAGKFMHRVRTVRHPLSEYIRFELDWGYPANVDAGEDIRILELSRDDELPWIPDPEAGYDFWLFDDVTVVRMDYDHEGRFLGPVDASEHLARFLECQQWAMDRAMPFRHWAFIRDTEQASH